ncbi:MAG: DUF1273 family protein [Clostridiales bacterium]|nr:DUF1273 family protein [Clostridiales bacterium]
MKSCSFFGHRDTSQTEELKQKIMETVEQLIVEEGVDTFLFGSRSKFDELCHMVVTELKEKYPHIQRIAYLCKHETACLAGAGMSLKHQIKELTGRDMYVAEYEDVKKSDRVNSAGRAAYVERNQWMIDESDYCVFYREMTRFNQKSGVFAAWDYAKQKRLICISC